MKALGVIALTLAAGTLAGSASAKRSHAEATPVASAASASASPPAPASAPAAASATAPAPMPIEPHTETPLAVRPSKPLTLSEAPSTVGGWKILALAAAAAAGVWGWKRRAARPSAKKAEAELAIVKRASIGMRSELLIVRVDGQRILLGVTPSAVQMLTTLSNDADEAAVESAEATSALAEPSDRFASILESSMNQAPAPRVAPPSAKTAVEGQARGLLALGSRR